MWRERFSRVFLNNKFVLTLLILLLAALNILVFMEISFIFTPLLVIIRTVALPIILTGIAYYLLNPIVNYLEKRGVKRGYSILGLYIAIIGLLTLVIFAIVPLIQNQIEGITEDFPRYVGELQDVFNTVVTNPFPAQLQETAILDMNSIIDNLSAWIASLINNAVSSIGAIVGAVTEVVIAIVTVPFILFYLLKDGSKLPAYIVDFLPVKLRKHSMELLGEMNHQISSYVRGQIIVSCCIGLLLYIGYKIIGLDYSLTLAAIAALTNVVPYLGPTIAITPALIIALVTSPYMLIKMIAVWTIVQLVEGKFISPQVMGKNLHVHPITIIFVILTSGKLFGVIGILLAVPGYAILKVICTHLFRWFKRTSKFYET